MLACCFGCCPHLRYFGSTTVFKLLSCGTLQYKFIVDGQWRHDPNLPCMYDDMGNINNVIEVQEYVPENLDGLSGFEPPPSPTARCAKSFRVGSLWAGGVVFCFNSLCSLPMWQAAGGLAGQWEGKGVHLS